jgi:hypothetical protein
LSLDIKADDLVTVQTHSGPRPARYVRQLLLRPEERGHLSCWHQVRLVYPSGVEGALRRFHEEDITKAPVCRVCGCSDFFACKGGCSWVEPDLCSSCAGSSE